MNSLAYFRSEVLRWNQSFSLVSRQNPEGQTDLLIRECLQAASLLREELAEMAPGVTYLYADLGTGGGFPGLLWAGALRGAGESGPHLLETHLVEPREKRAWFLEQTARGMDLAGVRVHVARWGRAGILSAAEAGLLVISMKALHLPDPDLLPAVAGAFPGARGPLLVVRFVTAEEARLGAMDPGLGVPSSGEPRASEPHHRFLLLPDRDLHSALLLSWYPEVPV